MRQLSKIKIIITILDAGKSPEKNRQPPLESEINKFARR